MESTAAATAAGSANGTAPGAGKVVCVTGASGFIASWLVKVLLDRGYTVHATVRDTADPKKTEHLKALEGAGERLHLFKADLVELGSFDAAITGSDCVFHTATPVIFVSDNPYADVIDPAVNGTLNVLNSCKRTPTVKRVILLSSTGAMIHNGRPKNPDTVIDDTWFSTVDFCEKRKSWYTISKLKAEEAAWKFSRENGLDLVTVHASYVIGPMIKPVPNTSVTEILNLINGSMKTHPNYCAGWVHAKDVALALALAFEVPAAAGRIVVSERVVHYTDIVKIIHESFPTLPVPETCKDNGKPKAETYQYSQEKAKTVLGFKEFIPLETSIKETIESLKDKGFVSF